MKNLNEQLPVFSIYEGNFVTPYLSVGPFLRPEHTADVAAVGVRGILNLMSTGERRHFEYVGHLPESVYWYHAGFWDGWLGADEPSCNETLTPTYARLLVQRAAILLRDHRPLLVHCGGGKSRAGNVAAILVAAQENISIDEAVSLLQSRRPSILKFNYGKYWKHVVADELVELARAVLAEQQTPGDVFCNRVRGLCEPEEASAAAL